MSIGFKKKLLIEKNPINFQNFTYLNSTVINYSKQLFILFKNLNHAKGMGLFFKRSYLKIIDKFGNELKRREIAKTNYYKQFLAFGKHIVGLYEVLPTSSTNSYTLYSSTKKSTTIQSQPQPQPPLPSQINHLIEIYDAENGLELLKSKSFDHSIELVLMNKREIVCKSRRTRNLFFFLDLDLNQVFSLSVNEKSQPNESSLSSLPDEVVLVGTSQNEIYLYVKATNTLKRVNRTSGVVDGVVELNGDEALSSAAASLFGKVASIRLDADCNVIVKSNETNKLRIFDFNLKNSCQVDTCAQLKKFPLVDLTYYNDLFYCDLLNKKILFL